MSKQNLLEKWEKVIKSKKAKPVNDPRLEESLAVILENTENYVLQEANQAGDIAQFTPILVPAVRRIFPQLIAHEVVSVQPLSAPTGYAYALRYAYANTSATPTDGVTNVDRGNYQAPKFGAIALIFDAGTNVDDNVDVYDAADTTKIGTTRYHENSGAVKVLVELETAGTNIPNVGDTVQIHNGGGTVAAVVRYVMNNEAGFNLIFRNYSGPYSTATGETLGANMKSMKMTIERVSVEAQTRKLKAEYTFEMIQDLKAIHGLDAEQELINILEYEIAAEIDRDLVDAMKNNATLSTPWSYNAGGSGVIADGNWEIEKFRTLYTKILKEASQIALTTRLGTGNFVVCSINVGTALQNLNNFMYSAVPSDLQFGTGIAKVGTLDGRISVFVDTFSFTDFCLVGYKGAGAMQTGICYCPYVPLQMQRIVKPDFQPALGFMTRSAIAENIYGTENFYRMFACDFTGSSLEGSYF